MTCVGVSMKILKERGYKNKSKTVTRLLPDMLLVLQTRQRQERDRLADGLVGRRQAPLKVNPERAAVNDVCDPTAHIAHQASCSRFGMLQTLTQRAVRIASTAKL